MSKWILRAAVVGLMTTGVASAQKPTLPPVSTIYSPKDNYGVKVFPVADLVNPPKGSPLAEPGDDEAMKAAANAYLNVKVEELKKDVLGSMTDLVWTVNRGSAGLEYFHVGQSLLVINTPTAIARVEQHLETMRKVKNTFVQVEVKLFKVPTDNDSVKKLFGDKSTATMTAEELKTLMTGLTKAGQLEKITEPTVIIGNKKDGLMRMTRQVPGNDTPVGVSCCMTPDVASDMKTIRLRVDVTNSTPSLSLVELGNGLKVQPINSQQTCTTLALTNGGTGAVRVGIHKVEQRIEQKVPVLGDLPYINRLFRNQGIGEMRVETIAVFTATQIKSDDKAALPPLPVPPPSLMPQYLPHPAFQPVQAVFPMPGK
jgi:Flp pilus assembly secretin CpaC